MTKKVLFLIGPEFEDLELFVPMYRLIEEGYEVVIASPNGGLVVGKHGYSIQTIKLTEVNPDEYVALVLPGGRGPERIRALARNEAVRIVKAFADSGKPIAAICHGPQLLISANIVKGRKITSYPGIADDVVNAGGFWINEPVVVDENIITSRVPDDLPYMMREFIKLLKGT
ncbi:MAG: type 1 glutamine amidotransferase domain-containing protein [Desulfurococcaceae archaeon]